MSMSAVAVTRWDAPIAFTPKSRNLPIGYLRAFVTLLVVAHHAVLAYHPYAPAAHASLRTEQWWMAFPVVDSARSGLFALFVGWNDVFFMSLMFLLSGLFVSRSLDRKGARSFLADRFVRLGVPFVASVAILAPLAYYPAYLTTPGHAGFSGFVREWLSLGVLPAGPAWFLWVLIAFGAAAVALQALRPGWDVAVGERLSAVLERPGRSFWLLVLLSAIAYLPMTFAFNPMHWAAWGPFTFQTTRLFHYAVYFFAGVVLGAYGIDRGLLAVDGRLARRWPLWTGGAVLAFAVTIVAVIVALAPGAGVAVRVAASLAFVVSCAASSFAMLAVFLRFARTRTVARESLRENAYGMYLFHYAFVSWLQLSLLPASLPGLAKGVLVFVGAALLSWGTAAAVRRIPTFERIL